MSHSLEVKKEGTWIKKLCYTTIVVYFLLCLLFLLAPVKAITTTYVPPTPTDNFNTSSTTAVVNTSVTLDTGYNLSGLIFNWNGTNETAFSNFSSLVLGLPFNNITEIGDNSTYTIDISKYGNNGTIYGATYTDGKFGKALSFDGVDDYVDCGNDSSLNSFLSTNEWSVVVWLCPMGNAQIVPIPLQKGSSYRLLGTQEPFKYTFTWFMDGGWYNPPLGDTEISKGEWVMVTGIYNGTYLLTYYNNAQLETSLNVEGHTPNNVSTNLKISMGSSYTFNGTIDEVMIFNRALSSEEIQQLYEATLYKHTNTNYIYEAHKQNLSDGSYTYYLYANNTNESSGSVIANQTSTKTVTVDTNSPTISLETPNNIAFNTEYGILRFIAVENANPTFSLPLEYTLYLDSQVLQTGTVNNNSLFTLNQTFSTGGHFWQVKISDNAGNTVYSPVYYFSIGNQSYGTVEVKDIEVDGGTLGDTFVITIHNPSGKTINVTFYKQNTNEQNESIQTTNTTIIDFFTYKGSWKAVVYVNGVAYKTFYFGLGSIIDTGFKSILNQAFGRNLYLISITVLAGISLFAISIGRYAGVPIIIIALGLFSMHNYIPSWLNYVIILVMAFMFATGLYILIGGRD